MAIDTSTFEGALQTKLDAVTDAKEMLLLGKALESTVGSIAVSDVTDAGTTQVGTVNSAGSTQVTAVNNAGTAQVAAVAAAGSNFVSKTGGTMTGTLHMADNAGITSVTSAGTVRVLNPGGGSRKNISSSETGAIRILVPAAATSPDNQGMFSFNVSVYEYSQGESFEVKVGGHNSGGTWHAHTGYIVGSPLMAQEHAIRFGRLSNSQYCVYIGETNTNWSYPQISVTSVDAGYAQTTANAYDNDWEVDIVTSFEGVSDTVAASDTRVGGGNSTVIATNRYEGSGKTTSGTYTQMVATDIVAPSDNPTIYVSCITSMAESGPNNDPDPHAAIGWKVGTYSSNASSYNSIHGTVGTRRAMIASLGNYWEQDTNASYQGHANAYMIKALPFSTSFIATGVNKGETVNVGLFVASINGAYWGTDSGVDGADGYISAVTLIAT